MQVKYMAIHVTNTSKMWKTHVDPNVLAEYKAKNLLRSQTHPYLPLTIWNYSAVCQYSKDKWDDITTLCRGLIVDNKTNEIVGRSFRKFFNEGEKMYSPTEDFTVWEKMDGSLGILFNYKGQWIITSRGSFTSDQAKKAQRLLKNKYDVSGLDADVSYVFEIIYPDNRIVVDYGASEELYFLAAFKRSGEEIFPPPKEQIKAAGFPICVSYPDFTSYEQLHSLDWAGHEGFVIRFSTGERMKIKFENYLELHRMATSLSPTMVYDWFCEKKPLADLLEISPDEFHPWVKEQWGAFQQEYDTLLASYKELVDQYTGLSQKDFALAIKDHPNKASMFAVRSGKDVFASLCRYIKPKSDEKLEWTESKGGKNVSSSSSDSSNSSKQQMITLMIGISGSGKSTYAKQQLITQPNTVIVSRDLIREQIFGYDAETITRYYEAPDLGKKEELVTQIEQSQIEAAALMGYDVIVDDTNLTQKTIKQFFTRFPQALFTYKVCECDVEEAIQRCKQRVRKVSEDVIRSQNTKLKMILPHLEELFNTQKVEPIIQDAMQPKAIIVDLDGTLALIGNRSPYDCDKVEEDVLNQPVYEVIKAMYEKGRSIILCSGRSEQAQGGGGTGRWLRKNNVPYALLYMREKDDKRPDYIVKEEIWRKIVKEFYIEFMLDDRNSVVNHARALGFTVFQVAPGNF